MPLRDPIVEPFEGVEYFGVAITPTDIGHHSAILYKIDNQPAMLLHLGWHNRLISDLPDSTYFWNQVDEIDEFNKHHLALQVQSVALKRPAIPYAFRSDKIVFSESGDIVGLAPGLGLTCSTFIWKILESFGYDILDETTWPEGVNQEYYKILLARLAATRDVPPSHVDEVARQVGARRVSPVQVVGIVDRGSWPSQFEGAEVVANEIIAEIAALTQERSISVDDSPNVVPELNASSAEQVDDTLH